MFNLNMKSIKANFKQNKNMIATNLMFIVLFSLFDQITKNFIILFFIKNNINLYEVLPFFNLTLVLNTGVSFGLFSGLMYGKIIISTIVICIILVLFYFFLKEKRFLLSLCYAMMIAGAIGNTVDRIRYGGVVDFLDFHLIGFHYPAFNIADSLVFCGALILICYDLFKKKYEN